MRDFYATTGAMPLDQADGLRRLFGGVRRRCHVPLVSNPHVAFSGAVIERLTAALGAAGRHTLVVDAADNAPAPHEMARVDLASAIEPLGPDVSYLAARGLPLAFVDTRGSASALLDALGDAAPQADVVLLHAGASDLARVFQRRAARPVVIGADHPESIKHAYASVKLLAQRCTLMTFDLLLAAPPRSPRLTHIAHSLAGTADGFLGSLLQAWAVVDPAGEPAAPPSPELRRLVQGQLALGADERVAAPIPAADVPSMRHERPDRGTPRSRAALR
jgi:flagellar biosynthesis protein FlhG